MRKSFLSSKLTLLGFWLPLCLILTCWGAATYRTRGALAWDGAIEHGFPFTFYSYFCGPMRQVGTSNCGSTFSVVSLILDLVILIAVPFLLNFVVLRFTSRHKN